MQGHNLQNLYIVQVDFVIHIQKAKRCNVENHEDVMNMEWST
jgi:hypothetical protein